MSNKSIETTNPDCLSLLKEHINSLKSKIYFLPDELRVKNDPIIPLISSKSAKNPVTIHRFTISFVPKITRLLLGDVIILSTAQW